MKKLFPIITILSLALALSAHANPLDAYNVEWTTPSQNHTGSMPIGNGETGLNVWVEPNGDLVFLIARTDAWDENERLCKLGRVRVQFTPSLAGTAFRQTLRLSQGMIAIVGGDLAKPVTARVWVDANQQVVHVTADSEQPFEARAALETWRNQETQIDGTYAHGVNWKQGPKTSYPDTVMTGQDNRVQWYHRNPTSPWDLTLRLQGLEAAIPTGKDPLLHRTFGGLMRGDGLVGVDDRTLNTAAPVRTMHLKIDTHTQVPATEQEWLAGIEEQAAATDAIQAPEATLAHAEWWSEFWNRSWIYATGDDDAFAVTQGYLLQRFISASGGRGKFPIKFNGTIFTVDEGDMPADYRAWGGCYWFQNTRLIYWPMLASGDFEMMRPLFRMYGDALPLAKTRTKTYFNHDGAFFPETLSSWGTYDNGGHGWGYRDDDNPGAPVVNEYVRFHYSGILELLAMMIDYYRFTGDTAYLQNELLMHADAYLTWWDQHWTRREDGMIHMYPSYACETFWNCQNPTQDLAGLRSCLDGLLALSDAEIGAERRAKWARFRTEIPPIPLRDGQGGPIISPAEAHISEPRNAENPELYAVFPFRLYGVGKPDLDLAQRSFAQRRVKANHGWHQDDTQAAFVGLADEAAGFLSNRAKTKHDGSRFPAFWGPNYDWIPDQCHGGNLVMGLQTMLLQPVGDRLILLPAWPSRWNVSFKLHAPQNTTIECEVTNGNVTKLIVTPVSRLQNVEISSPFVPMQATLPTAPTGLSATAVSSSTINLGWDDIAVNETGYRVERSTTSGSGFTQIALLDAGATTYSDIAVHASTTYYYRVCATNALGDSIWSGEAFATSRPEAVVTTISTGGFNTGAWAPADPWGVNAANTVGRWSLAQTAAGGGRLVIGNPWGYGGQATPQEGTGQAQFSNGGNSAFSATLKDMTGIAFAVGQEVAMNFFLAGRSGTNSMALTIDLVDGNNNVIHTFGSYAPTNGSTTWGAFTTGSYTIAAAGTYGVRFTHATSGADLTTYLDSVSYLVGYYPFASWMATTYPAIVSPNHLPGADPDHDGIANLLEYLLQGGNPSASNTGILPTVDASGANFVFTYFRRAATTGITQTFQYGSTLSGWTNVGIPGGPGVLVTDQGGGIEKVEVSVAIGANTKLFGRLHVSQP